jgi:hypothetical protein
MGRICEKLISAMDAKIRRGERRAAEELLVPEAPTNVDTATRTAQQEQIDSIERRIAELMADMDKLAEEGEIDAIDGMVDKVERLKVFSVVCNSLVFVIHSRDFLFPRWKRTN